MNFLTGVCAAIGILASASVAFSECASDAVSLRGPWGQASFSVELAVTPQERGRGLMNRDHMDRNAGMLFIFDPPRSVSFWMSNTLIPLDMLFVDRTGVVRRIHENAIPLDETQIPGGRNVYAVLEINGGLSNQLGIVPGTEIRHPLFGELAAWSCPEN